MQSINEQLEIGVPKNPNIPSKYARGLLSIQPQLGTEDWSLDQYNEGAETLKGRLVFPLNVAQ